MKVSHLLVLIAALVAVAYARVQYSEKQLRGEFAHFTLKFNRQYTSSLETEGRYQIFRANYIRALELNEQNGEHAHGTTRFMDWTFEEKKAFLGYKPDVQARRATKYNVMEAPKNVQAVPEPFDWRPKAVTPVRDQGQCGSCWAYSAVEQVESAMMLKYNNASNEKAWLSTQQVVSCDPYDWGCRGGDTISAYRYMLSARGLASEVAYPYKAADTQCYFNASTPIVSSVSDWSWVLEPCDGNGGDCTRQDEAAMAEIMRSKGPASICVMVSDDWFSYTGPAPYKGTCTNNYYDLNHCVQVVGIGKAADDSRYWITRNSWGTSWGHNGYIYLPYGNNVCGVADEVTMVQVK